MISLRFTWLDPHNFFFFKSLDFFKQFSKLFLSIRISLVKFHLLIKFLLFFFVVVGVLKSEFSFEPIALAFTRNFFDFFFEIYKLESFRKPSVPFLLFFVIGSITPVRPFFCFILMINFCNFSLIFIIFLGFTNFEIFFFFI